METNRPPTMKDRGTRSGILAFLSGLATTGSVAMIGFTSFTDFNPPDWLRILSMAPLPVVIIFSVVFGLAGLKSSPGRGWAIAGLMLAGLAVVGFGVMLGAGG